MKWDMKRLLLLLVELERSRQPLVQPGGSGVGQAGPGLVEVWGWRVHLQTEVTVH